MRNDGNYMNRVRNVPADFHFKCTARKLMLISSQFFLLEDFRHLVMFDALLARFNPQPNSLRA